MLIILFLGAIALGLLVYLTFFSQPPDELDRNGRPKRNSRRLF